MARGVNDLFTIVMNHLRGRVLHNRYWAMRHGQSVSNVQRCIVGDPVVGLFDYGLTPLGRSQVRIALDSHFVFQSKKLRIFTSDFLRTRQTAAMIQAHCRTAYATTSLLRERFFGIWEGKSSDVYQHIWQADIVHYATRVNNVESVSEVMDRTTRCVVYVESLYEDADILLVSHGDTIQMLQAAFQDIVPPMHQTIAHLQNAQIIQLNTL